MVGRGVGGVGGRAGVSAKVRTIKGVTGRAMTVSKETCMITRHRLLLFRPSVPCQFFQVTTGMDIGYSKFQQNWFCGLMTEFAFLCEKNYSNAENMDTSFFVFYKFYRLLQVGRPRYGFGQLKIIMIYLERGRHTYTKLLLLNTE